MPEVLLTDRTDGVLTLTMNRPDAMNAVSLELKLALLDELRAARDDDSVRAVVLTGTGRGFCVGQDLREHAEGLQSGAAPLNTVTEHFNPIIELITGMPKPTIAAVNGMAAGAGAGLAFACDLRILSSASGFLIAFANVGLSLDSGVSWTLPRLVGFGRAMELSLLAQPIDAQTALSYGLGTQLVAPDELVSVTAALAGRLAAGPTAAYNAIKTSLTTGVTSTLSQTLAVEAELQTQMGATVDHPAATAAFVNKQKPTFVGH